MGRPLGSKHSEETKAKLRAAFKKLWQDSEYREHMVNAHKGHSPSIETRAKISAAKKGKHLTEEAKKKVAIASRGRHHTDEAKAKISASNKGRHFTKESRAKISASRKGYHPTEEAIANQSAAHRTEESRAKISAAQRGKHYSEERKAKMSITTKALWQDPKFRARVVAGNKATKQSLEYRANASAIMKACWQNPEFSEKMRKARNTKPNKAEVLLQNILDKHYPNEWKFVGDGQINLGGRWPDFINRNGKKEVIELFSNYWHPMFDVAKKKEHYRQYGFRVAIIWEDELKDEERLVKTFRKRFR